jgi:hypothetical protein
MSVVAKKIAKVRKRVRRAAVATRYGFTQLRHLGDRPKLTAVGRRVVDDLAAEGIAMVHVEDLGLASTAGLLRTIDRVNDELEEIARTPPARNTIEYAMGFEHSVPINPSRIATQYPELFSWGLDDGLLDIVENCLGLPSAYHGVCVRRELVDGKFTGTRLWHMDSEDLNTIRVMIYLNDVLDDAGGPFEYVPKPLTPAYRRFVDDEDITDDRMNAVVPASEWKRCLGKRGTVIFGAVAKIFHHGKLPFNPRKMVSYYYTSRKPYDEALCRQFSFETGVPQLQLPLSPRQYACMWKYAELLPKQP